MRHLIVAAALLVAACGGDDPPALITDAHVIVNGLDVENMACRDAICPHNENTDLINYDGAIYLVHRTAISQVLGPNSSLRILRSDDDGATWDLLAVLPAIDDRDLRDPHFYVIDGNLAIKALTRLAINSTRDSNVDTISVGTVSTDGGTTWSPLAPIGPATWSFWRIQEHAGTYYTAAYEDGDLSVKLFTSTDGTTWDPGAVIFDISEDTPLETELTFMPSGKLMALVRVDGTDDELLGAEGRLRTIVCWADPPYDNFDCPQTLDGQRFDGPLTFWHGDRLFELARKHLPGGADKKRTALYELGGDLDGGPITVTELAELPSAGDTAYAGQASIDDDHVLVTWYSSDVVDDQSWVLAIFLPADIWQATIDFSAL